MGILIPLLLGKLFKLLIYYRLLTAADKFSLNLLISSDQYYDFVEGYRWICVPNIMYREKVLSNSKRKMIIENI